MSTVEQRLAKLLTLLLQQTVTTDTGVSMQSCLAWDSIKHIEIILTVEQHFGISLAPQDIPRLTSQFFLADKVKECMGAE